MKKVLAILCAVLFIGAAGTVQAQPIEPITLADLLGGGTITVGDKLFSNWSVVQNYGGGQYDPINDPNAETTFVAYDPVDTSLINVLPLDANTMNPGIQFQATQGALSIGILPNYFGQLDFEFTFDVTVQDPTKLITDNSLQLGDATISTSAGGSGTVTIREGVSAGHDLVVYFDSDLDPSLWILFDSQDFAGQSSITVDKNILLAGTGGDSGTTITLGSFDQHFSQTVIPQEVVIPEPGTLVLVTTGLLGIGFFVRRRRSK